MSNDLERIIAELEGVTARMLATTCWEQSGEFGELMASRGALSTLLIDREDLDVSGARRIGAVIHAGNDLMVRVMAMRQSVLDSLAETEAQRRFTRGLGRMLPGHAQPHHVDMKA